MNGFDLPMRPSQLFSDEEEDLESLFRPAVDFAEGECPEGVVLFNGDEDWSKIPEEPPENVAAFNAVLAAIKHLHRKEDITPLLEHVRFCFASPYAMFRARRHLWERIGMKPSEAMYFGMMLDIGRYTERTSYGKSPKIDRLKTSSGYFLSNFYGLQIERLYLYCINHRGCLKERLMLHEGIEDGVLFSLSKLMCEVGRVKPAAVIVAHNHPGGTLRPSQGDIDCTVDILNAMTALEVPLLDHLIVAGRTVMSMRDNGFIPEAYWMNQNPKNRFLRNWLLEENQTAPKKSTLKKSKKR